MTSVSDVVSRRTPALGQLVAQLGGVGEVAVVARGPRCAPGGGARRAARWASATSRWWSSGRGRSRLRPLEGLQRGLVEDLRDEPEILQRRDAPAVGHGDAGALLAAVLQGVEPEVRRGARRRGRARRGRRCRTSSGSPGRMVGASGVRLRPWRPVASRRCARRRAAPPGASPRRSERDGAAGTLPTPPSGTSCIAASASVAASAGATRRPTVAAPSPNRRDVGAAGAVRDSSTSTPRPPSSADSARATARPPSEASWALRRSRARGAVGEQRCRARRVAAGLRRRRRPSIAPCTRALVLRAVERRHAVPSASSTTSPAARRPAGDRVRRRDSSSPTQPTIGVGGMGAAGVLVVERDVAGDDRDAERLAGLGHALDGLGQHVRRLAALGVAEVEAVRDRRRARRRCRRRSAPPRRRPRRRRARGSSQVRRPLPSSATAMARSDGVRRTTPASPPGRTIVPEPTTGRTGRRPTPWRQMLGAASRASSVAPGSSGAGSARPGRPARSPAGRAARA